MALDPAELAVQLVELQRLTALRWPDRLWCIDFACWSDGTRGERFWTISVFLPDRSDVDRAASMYGVTYEQAVKALTPLPFGSERMGVL